MSSVFLVLDEVFLLMSPLRLAGFFCLSSNTPEVRADVGGHAEGQVFSSAILAVATTVSIFFSVSARVAR